MKCIKAVKETKKYKVNDIARVSDTEADEKVLSGFFKFIPKSEWKATRVTKKEEVKQEQPVTEVTPGVGKQRSPKK